MTDTDFDYPAVLVARAGRFHCHIPELGLTATGDDPSAAYDALQAEKVRFLERARQTGLADLLAAGPRRAAEAVGQRRSISRFLLKGAIAGGIVLTLILVASWNLNALIGSAAGQFGLDDLDGRAFWTALEDSLYEAAEADNALPPERQERLVASLSVLVARAQPFVETLRPLLAPAPACTVEVVWPEGFSPPATTPAP